MCEGTNKKLIDAGNQSNKISLNFYLQLQGIALIQQLFIIDDKIDFCNYFSIDSYFTYYSVNICFLETIVLIKIRRHDIKNARSV